MNILETGAKGFMDKNTSASPVKILYIHGGIMNRGGTESFMMSYFRCFDRKKIIIDFMVHGYEKGYYDEEILETGSKIINVPVKSQQPFKYNKILKKVFQSGEYPIVHSHLDAMSAWTLKIAKKCGVPHRIAHSHNTAHLTENKMKLAINEIARKQITKYATDCFACSDLAGKWLFNDAPFKVIHNAINISKYQYSGELRTTLRNSLGISESTYVIGHVGRFDTQKNHEFLVEVFSKVIEVIPNSTLLLIGEGWKMEQIKEKVSNCQLNEKVLFLGSRADVNELYNAMDLFVLPSLFEGLSVVAVEAQANGLECLFSDKTTQEAKMSDNVEFLPLKVDVWAEKIIDSYKCKKMRFDNTNALIEHGYEIKSAAEKLQEYYLQLLDEGR